MILNMRSVAVAAAVISGFAASGNLMATCTATAIVYQASGEFGSNIISGADKLELAGEPFSITLYACSNKVPVKTGSDYADYAGLELKGEVKSRLLTSPTAISTVQDTFILAVPATGYDTIQLTGSVVIEGGTINIKANIALPLGTYTTTSIGPFPSTSIVTAKSEFTYSQTSPAWTPNTAYAVGAKIMDAAGDTQEVTVAGTSGATAPAWNNTLNGTTTDNTVTWSCQGVLSTSLSIIGTAAGNVESGSVKASPVLHNNAVQVITAHADGSQSQRPLTAAPVDPGASTDKTMLQFYASGVRDASEVHVQIAGQEVPVVYAGPAGHFPGLDEVTVEVPRSLSGMGESDVVLTADGESASPVRIHVQ
ncbi:MAG TPA: hypothetical protein VN924_13605 [Bryobacteraceae bacterium]|jgi:hypothetical protein|nr:hypothetical protein [Bryobacteraceae bacterium]